MALFSSFLHLFTSPRLHFIFQEVENFRASEVTETAELVQLVIDENYRIKESREKGEVTILCYRGEKTLLGREHLNFPMPPETNFDELFSDFYDWRKLPSLRERQGADILQLDAPSLSLSQPSKLQPPIIIEVPAATPKESQPAPHLTTVPRRWEANPPKKQEVIKKAADPLSWTKVMEIADEKLLTSLTDLDILEINETIKDLQGKLHDFFGQLSTKEAAIFRMITETKDDTLLKDSEKTFLEAASQQEKVVAVLAEKLGGKRKAAKFQAIQKDYAEKMTDEIFNRQSKEFFVTRQTYLIRGLNQCFTKALQTFTAEQKTLLAERPNIPPSQAVTGEDNLSSLSAFSAQLDEKRNSAGGATLLNDPTERFWMLERNTDESESHQSA